MYSRLLKHDRSSLIKQTVFFFGLSIALSLAFLFVILPLFIKFLAFRNLSSKITYTEENTLSMRPYLSAPYDATSSAQISLSGTAQSGQKIILLQNGASGADTTANDQGSFSFDSVSLEAGQNTFSAVSENAEGERSNPSNVVTISYVKDAPKLEVSEPANDSTVTQRKQNPVRVRGKTDPGNKVYISDRLQFVSGDGSFTGQVQLSEGENTITVKAVNPAQIETIQEIKVKFSP